MFLEYAQARDFHIDPARVRRPQDKGRVERSVRDTRDDCFGGEHLWTLEQTRERALEWARTEYGMRRHTTTQRLPREHFESVEAAHLLPAPTTRYDVPPWGEPKVGRDHLAQVVRALYSLPTRWIGTRVRARADRATVRFYFRGRADQDAPAQAPGERSIDPPTSPTRSGPYALRDVAYLQSQATACGPAVGWYAAALLAGPLPWTRMRRVYALLRLVRRYGEARVDASCDDRPGAPDVRRAPSGEHAQASGPAAVPCAGTGAAAGALPARPAPVRPARGAPGHAPTPAAADVPHPPERAHEPRDPLSPDLIAVLRRLKLGRMLDTLPERLTLARQQKMAHQDLLLLVLSDEVSRRDSAAAEAAGPQGAARSQHAAGALGSHGEGHLRPGAVQRTRPRCASSRRTPTSPSSGRSVSAKPFSPTRSGTSPAAAATRCSPRRVDHLLKTLRHARLDHSHETELRKRLAVDLLLIDDFGLEAMTPEESRDIYALMTERHRRASMIVTSNRGPDEWLATFADPVRAQGAIDRFTSNAYDLVIDGESYRPRQKPTFDRKRKADA